MVVPAWVYTGLIPMTWLVYIFSYTLRRLDNGMMYANLAVMGVFLVSGIVIYIVRGVQRELHLPKAKTMVPSVGEVVFFVLVLYSRSACSGRRFALRGIPCMSGFRCSAISRRTLV